MLAQAQKAAVAGDALSILIGLARRARRAASVEELGFVMVNETVALAPYRQALLWRADGGVAALSGVAAPEDNAPYTLWLDRLLRGLAPTLTRARAVTAADVAAAEGEPWREWLPEHLLLLPLAAPDGHRLGVLGYARPEPWSEAEILFLAEVAETYALAWAWHRLPGPWQAWRRRFTGIRRRWWYAAAAVLAIALLPVRLSVLAPADVVARDPAAIRAPLEGVVGRILVQPNQTVAAGDPLVDLDTTMLRGKLDVARKALATARAEYEQAAQQAFFDPKAKAQLGVLTGRIGEREAEIASLTDQLDRSHIRAPRAGVAVLDDPAEWIGRPVTVGERILAVADERDTEVEGWLAPADMIALPPDSPATLFLNVDPLHPVHARLRYVAYEGQLRPDNTLAHRLRAVIEAGDRPRLGLKGTVRLDGRRVPLLYWLLRRPWAVARQTLGW